MADPTRDQAVRLALRRYMRMRGSRQRQAVPLNQAAVAAILATTRRTALRDLRDLALLLVLRDLLGRRGEVCALDVADITPEPDGSATVLIRRSKTDQAGNGAVAWLSPQAHAALRKFWSTAGITTGPALRSLRKGGSLGGRLQEGDVAKRLKAMAARAGIDATNVSGHSWWIAMAQDQTASGFGLPEIMQAGRWRSPAMVARYTERFTAARGAVARFHGRTADTGPHEAAVAHLYALQPLDVGDLVSARAINRTGNPLGCGRGAPFIS